MHPPTDYQYRWTIADIGDNAVVLVAPKGSILIYGDSLELGPVLYTAGSEVRAFERGQYSFMPGSIGNAVLDDNGQEWEVTEEALVGPDNQRLPRLNGHIAYWFGWNSFFPNTLIYE
jgi:hypothetical protein